MAIDPLVLVRRYIDDPDKVYSDTELSDRLTDAAGSPVLVARDVWIEKMAAAAALVNVSEGGSSRALSAVYDHAKDMVAYWSARADAEAGTAATVLRRLVR